MATKESKVERVKSDKDKNLFTDNPTALVEAIAATPLVGACVGAAVAVCDIHNMESRISKDATNKT